MESSETKRRRLKAVGAAVLDGLEANGLPGLVSAVAREISEDQPSFDCLSEASDAFGSVAVDDSDEEEGNVEESIPDEQSWDAALDMADCLRGAILEPDLPEPPEQPPEPPEPDRGHSMADVVLAALLVHLRKEGARRRVPERAEAEAV